MTVREGVATTQLTKAMILEAITKMEEHAATPWPACPPHLVHPDFAPGGEFQLVTDAYEPTQGVKLWSIACAANCGAFLVFRRLTRDGR